MITDANNVEIKEGSKVLLSDYNPVFDTYEYCHGEVYMITDPDGDVKEGKVITYPPRVYVRFDDGVKDDFYVWEDKCDDLIVKEN